MRLPRPALLHPCQKHQESKTLCKSAAGIGVGEAVALSTELPCLQHLLILEAVTSDAHRCKVLLPVFSELSECYAGIALLGATPTRKDLARLGTL